jgi:hypothetical protein
MFEVGDRVISETDDELNGHLGEVLRVGWDEHEGDYAILLLDEDQGNGLPTLFLFSELRKVDA